MKLKCIYFASNGLMVRLICLYMLRTIINCQFGITHLLYILEQKQSSGKNTEILLQQINGLNHTKTGTLISYSK